MSATTLGPDVIAADYTPGGVLTRARAGVILVCALLLAAALVPLDGTISAWAVKAGVRGDLKRELEFLQQYGGVSCLALIGLAILFLDRARAVRVADMIAASLLTVITLNVVKYAVGRPRPSQHDPYGFAWPWTARPYTAEGGRVERYAWEFWRARELHLSELWSMPSSHTAAAAALSVFLLRAYPRLRPLCIGMIAVVGLCRIFLGAHYPSDVVVGGALGYVVSRWTIERGVGRGVVRALLPEKKAGFPSPRA